MSRRRTEKGEENGPQGTEASTKTLLEMFMEQQRAQHVGAAERKAEDTAGISGATEGRACAASEGDGQG